MSPTVRASVLAAALASVVVGACSTLEPTFRPRGGRTAGNSGGPEMGPGSGADLGTGRVVGGRDSTLLGRPRDRATRVPNDRGRLDVRRVCRTSAFPRGWIAVAYEAAASECPRSAANAVDSVGRVAVIVRYANAPVDTRLDVCADQAIPSGWSPASNEGPGDLGACPQAVRRGDTVVRIRRDY